jgi:hypothetical protein
VALGVAADEVDEDVVLVLPVAVEVVVALDVVVVAELDDLDLALQIFVAVAVALPIVLVLMVVIVVDDVVVLVDDEEELEEKSGLKINGPRPAPGSYDDIISEKAWRGGRRGCVPPSADAISHSRPDRLGCFLLWSVRA